jgi:hypothetical protein
LVILTAVLTPLPFPPLDLIVHRLVPFVVYYNHRLDTEARDGTKGSAPGPQRIVSSFRHLLRMHRDRSRIRELIPYPEAMCHGRTPAAAREAEPDAGKHA